jgi:Tfp pilus assembly protein PilO
MKSRGRLNDLIDIIKTNRLFWIVCGALLLANILFYAIFVASGSSQTAQLQNRFQTERKKVMELRKQQAAIREFQSLQEAWTNFEALLPGKITFPERIQQLKQMLNRYRLHAEDLSFKSDADREKNLVRFTTTLRTSGEYGDFKHFIGDLQALPGLFCIQRLDLRQPEGGKPLEMELELSAYFRDDQKSDKS